MSLESAYGVLEVCVVCGFACLFLVGIAAMVLWIANVFKVEEDRCFREPENSDDSEDVEWDHRGRAPTDEDFDN